VGLYRKLSPRVIARTKASARLCTLPIVDEAADLPSANAEIHELVAVSTGQTISNDPASSRKVGVFVTAEFKLQDIHLKSDFAAGECGSRRRQGFHA
jgi:hypothetical protein